MLLRVFLYATAGRRITLKILPFQQLGARSIRFEVIKTGRRLWVTIRIDPEKDSVKMDEFIALVKQLRSFAKEIYAGTLTEVILEGLRIKCIRVNYCNKVTRPRKGQKVLQK